MASYLISFSIVIVRIVFLKSVRSWTNLNLSTDVPQLSQAFLPFRLTSSYRYSILDLTATFIVFVPQPLCASLFQLFRYWGAVRRKKESEKIKARESPSAFHRFLYFALLSTISTLYGSKLLCAKTLLFCLIRLCRQSSKIRPVIVFFLFSSCQSLLSLHLYWMRICS